MPKKKNRNSGETLVSIIVGVFILAIVAVSIANIVATNYSLEDDYNRNNILYILQNNATNAARRVDTSGVAEGELFYLHKDPVAKTFSVFTGTTNEKYKYIDADGELVADIDTYPNPIFTQIFLAEQIKAAKADAPSRQVIKTSLKEMIRK